MKTRPLSINRSFTNRYNTLLIIAIFAFSFSNSKGNGIWNYVGLYNGGNCDITFYFTVGQKGYVGGGRTSLSTFKNDFWEFNPITNSWTQLADYLGGDKGQQIAFASPNKGYVGLGFDGNAFYKDFYEYDPLTNIWLQKATFPGSGRYSSLSFYIDGNGYVATGFDGSPKKDVWEYNVLTDSWVQKNNFPGPARQGANGFAIGDTGYILAGFNNGTSFNDFWKYYPSNDLWIQKASFPSIPRRAMSYFVINGSAYAGLGYDNSIYYNDLYSFDTSSNQWHSETNFGGVERYLTFSFNINNTGYLGTGSNGQIGSPNFLNDVWEFIPGATSISETGLNNNKIWYNGLSNEIHIKFHNPIHYSNRFELQNSSGTVIHQSKLNSKSDHITIDIPPSLKTGIYFYTIHTSNNSNSQGKIYISNL